MSQRTALLIIDMQQGMSWPSLPQRNNPDAESAIFGLLQHWRFRKAPVVHVRHISRIPGSPFWPGQPGVDFQFALAPLPHEHVVDKSVPDAFVNTGLGQWLHQRDIGSVVVVGVSTNNSVEATVRTAGNLGFQTYVASDATFAFAKKDFAGTPRSADDVHNMSLANLHGEYATVLPAQALMRMA
ncbi:MAG: cysteine hydrolase family protein [Rhodoferax sp.]